MSDGNMGGLFQAIFWRRNPSGIAIGNATSDTPTPGSTLHAYRIPGVSNLVLNEGEFTILEYFESDAVGDQLTFGDTRLRSIQLTLESEDEDFQAWLSGTSVDNTYNSVLVHSTREATAFSLLNIGVMITQMGKNKLSGVRFYRHLVAPNAEGSGKDSAWGYQTKKTIELNLTVHKSNKDLHGYLFSDMDLDAPNGELRSYRIHSDYPLALTTNIGDGVASTFQSQYRPVSNVVTVNATPNHFAINSVPTAPTSFDTADGTLTKAALGISGDVESLLYSVPEHFPLSA